MKKWVLCLPILLAVNAVPPVLAQVSPAPKDVPEAESSADAPAVAPEDELTVDTATASPEAEPSAAMLEPVRMLPTVPRLNITWDCGDCEHNDKVLPLIEQAYTEEAKKHSFTVSQTDVADVSITDIRQRPPGVRVMFGFMAGKDRLGLRIRYSGQEYTVSDTSANAIMGLNYLSASVGKRAYAELSKKAAR